LGKATETGATAGITVQVVPMHKPLRKG